MSWPVATVGEVCEVVSGATPRSGKPEFWGGNVPWVTPKDLSELGQKHLSDTPRKITKAGLDSCSARMLPAQSVLFSSRAPIGLVAINTLPVCTNQGFKSLVPRFDLVSPDFLFWWLKAHEKHIQSKGRGATFKEVSKKIVENLQIPIPPLTEQKRIARILDAADALRAKRREALAQLDTLLQSTFLDMFGDPVTNPLGWEVQPLNELLGEKSTNGAYYPKDAYSSVGTRMVHMANAFYGVVNPNEVKRVDAPPADTEKYGLLPTDILVSRRSLNYEGSAKPCLIPETDEPLMFESSLIRVRPDREKVLTIYLFHYLLNDRARAKYVFPLVTRSTISGISQSNLMKVKVVLPPLDLQLRFAVVVESIERQKASQRAHLAELDTLFASLQSRAFRGDL